MHSLTKIVLASLTLILLFISPVGPERVQTFVPKQLTGFEFLFMSNFVDYSGLAHIQEKVNESKIKRRRTLLLQSNTHNHKRGLFTSIKNVQRTEGTTKPEKRYIKMYNAEATNSKEKTLQQMIIRPKPLRQQEQQRTPSATKNRVEWSQKLQHKYKLSTDSEEKFAASRVDDPLREHKIIHLISRPTQLYYQDFYSKKFAGDNQTERAILKEIKGRGQICRARVPVGEIYVSYDNDQETFMDIIFHCPNTQFSWCCGVDCCQIDPTLLFMIGISLLVGLFIGARFCLRSEFAQEVFYRCRLLQRIIGVHRRKKITRTRAQRRRRSETSSNAVMEELDVRQRNDTVKNKKLSMSLEDDIQEIEPNETSNYCNNRALLDCRDEQ